MSYDDGSSEGGLKGTFENYRAEAEVMFKQHEYKKAIDRYDTALELRPGDISCLIARSKCYQELGELDKALKDSDEVLKDEPNHVKGVLQKAEVLYSMGDFETALVFFHRGKKIRPEIREFTLGIQKSTSAIENAVGPESGVKLRSSGDLSFFYEAQEQSETDTETEDEAEVQQAIFSNLQSQRAYSQAHCAFDGTGTCAFGRARPTFDQMEEDAKFDALVASFMQQYLKAEKQTKKKGYSKPLARKEEKQTEKLPKSKQSIKTIKELLGELYSDKEYLDGLLMEIEETGANTKTNEEIKQLAIEGLKYLNSRSEFWQQQKPLYSRKRDKEMRDRTKSNAMGKGSTDEKTQYVIAKLEEIDEAQVKGEYEKSLSMAKKLLKEVEKWKEADENTKHEMLSNIHSLLGNAYLELGEYDKALAEHNKDMDIANRYDLEDAKSRALDNLGRVYARMSKFEEAIEVWENKLPMARSSLEKTWLYHEIGRCYLELKEYEKAQSYGEKSLAAAQECGDEVWQLNATVLIAQSQVKCGELQASLDSFEKALEMAKSQDDKQAENAIRKALDDVKKKIVKGVKDEVSTWHIKVYTSDVEDAATTANVYVIIKGKKQDGTEATSEKLELKGDSFEKGKCNEFDIETENFSRIDSIMIGHDNSGTEPGWHLDKVELKNTLSGKSYEASCGKWLDENKDDRITEMELPATETTKDTQTTEKKDDSEGRVGSPASETDKHSPRDEDDKVRWTVKVYTTDMNGAGTDANVYIIMFGSTKDKDKAQSEKIPLDNTSNNFESGKTDEFQIETLNFEHVNKIRIGHDNSGMLSAWHLDKVELENQSTKKKFTFPCDCWLADDKDDNATERELTEGTKPNTKQLVPWTVKIYTTDEMGAGTDANVYLYLFGKHKNKNNVQSDKINLDNKDNNFEAGKFDEFEIETLPYEKVEKIRIGHDNKGLLAGWHLHKVELVDKSSKKSYTFICNKWLADDKDDKKIERDLFVEDNNKNKTNPKGNPAQNKNAPGQNRNQTKSNPQKQKKQEKKEKSHEKPKEKSKGPHRKDEGHKGQAKNKKTAK